jgi:hypothetical protein
MAKSDTVGRVHWTATLIAVLVISSECWGQLLADPAAGPQFPPADAIVLPSAPYSESTPTTALPASTTFEPLPESPSEPWQPPVTDDREWWQFDFADAEAYLLRDDRQGQLSHTARYRRMQSLSELSSTNSTWVGGWLEVGETLNADRTYRDLNYPVMFNYRNTTPLLNQLYLFVESTSGADHTWKWNNRIDVILGSDGAFVRASGLEIESDDDPIDYPAGSHFHLAVPQAYTEFQSPGNWSFRLGHFYAPATFEGVPAAENFFYSHSLMFGASPFTYTGALATYTTERDHKYFFGVTHSSNSFISSPYRLGAVFGYLGRTADRNTTFGYTYHLNEEETIIGSTEPRFIGNFLYLHHFGNSWTYVAEPNFGVQKYGKIDGSWATVGPARWYGVNQELIYHYSECVDIGTRLEWFRDHDHLVYGLPIWVGGGRDYISWTNGINYRVRRNLLLRPELRVDWTNIKGNANPWWLSFDALSTGDSLQLTAAADLIWTF